MFLDNEPVHDEEFDPMKTLLSFLLPALCGALCLPLTFRLSRADNFPASLLIVVALGAAGGAIAAAPWRGTDRPRISRLTAAFAIGALVSEGIFFGRYYLEIGYRDPELTLGVFASILEFGAIALIGAMATAGGAIVVRRLGPSPASAGSP